MDRVLESRCQSEELNCSERLLKSTLHGGETSRHGDVSNLHHCRHCFNVLRDSVPLCVMRLPNNQSLTRLVLPLSSSLILSLSLSLSVPRAPSTSPHTRYPTSPTPTDPFSQAAKLWHVGFASILLNYPPGQESFSRLWIDKLPDPVFRRHVTLDVATSNIGKCYELPSPEMHRRKSN